MDAYEDLPAEMFGDHPPIDAFIDRQARYQGYEDDMEALAVDAVENRGVSLSDGEAAITSLCVWLHETRFPLPDQDRLAYGGYDDAA